MQNLRFNLSLKKFIQGALFSIVSLILITLTITTLAIFSLDYIKPAGLMPVENQQGLVIDNVNIIMVKTNQVLKQRQLVINQGRITAINTAGSVVSNRTRIIDGDGMYVTPGLFDMHVHLGECH